MWIIKARPSVKKDLKRIDPKNRKKIEDYLYQKVAKLQNPRDLGKALSGSFKGLWRYRVGNYRIIVRIFEQDLEILTLRVAHRRDVYD